MIVWRFRFTTTTAHRDERLSGRGGFLQGFCCGNIELLAVGLSQTIHEEEYWRKVEQKLQTCEVSVKQIEDHHRLKTK